MVGVLRTRQGCARGAPSQCITTFGFPWWRCHSYFCRFEFVRWQRAVRQYPAPPFTGSNKARKKLQINGKRRAEHSFHDFCELCGTLPRHLCHL